MLWLHAGKEVALLPPPSPSDDECRADDISIKENFQGPSCYSPQPILPIPCNLTQRYIRDALFDGFFHTRPHRLCLPLGFSAIILKRSNADHLFVVWRRPYRSIPRPDSGSEWRTSSDHRQGHPVSSRLSWRRCHGERLMVIKTPEALTLSFAKPRTIEIQHFLGVDEKIAAWGGSINLPPMALYKMPGGREVIKEWPMFDSVDATPSNPAV